MLIMILIIYIFLHGLSLVIADVVKVELLGCGGGAIRLWWWSY